MASQKFYIIDNPEGNSDGVIKDRNKDVVGYAYNQPAPVGSFINCSLDGHWIITDEELKEYKQLKNENNKRLKQGITE